MSFAWGITQVVCKKFKLIALPCPSLFYVWEHKMFKEKSTIKNQNPFPFAPRNSCNPNVSLFLLSKAMLRSNFEVAV